MNRRQIQNPALGNFAGDGEEHANKAKLLLNSRGQREMWVAGVSGFRKSFFSIAEIACIMTPTSTAKNSAEASLEVATGGVDPFPPGCYLIYLKGGAVIPVTGEEIDQIVYGDATPDHEK